MRSQRDYDALERRNADLEARVGAAESVRSTNHNRPFDPELDLTPSARPSAPAPTLDWEVDRFASQQGAYVTVALGGEVYALTLGKAEEIARNLCAAVDDVRRQVGARR